MRFDDHNYAEFYDSQQQESGYPGGLLAPVIRELEGYYSVIDIGAGTGFFSIPLASSGHRVTAVEPSKEMSDIMMKKCPPDFAGLISVINERWEESNCDRHDAAISVHSIYPMSSVKKAIELIHSSASKRIIIAREPSGMKSLAGEVRRILGIELNRDFNPEIKSVLTDLGADYHIKNIAEERTRRIVSFEDEADSVMYQLKLDKSRRSRVISVITDLCSAQSGGIFHTAVYSDNIYIF